MLAELGLEFTVAVAAIAEVAGAGEGPADFARRLALEKAAAVAPGFPEAWVLGADTVVVLEDRILGKPADAGQAEAMLAALSGREHTVWTAFALCRGREQAVAAVSTRVWFAELDPALIRAYVATGEPLDKAGAYGVQGRGGALVAKIEGSVSNVIGLPLAEVTTALITHDIIVPS